jgi:leucyl-tRNA synthetase
MDREYDFKSIEKKWQTAWEDAKLFRAENDSKKPKKYVLVEFPYPSGDGLHVGHCRSYTALDIVARKSRMEGFNVMYPMGWDAFGLPTENYAIKTGIHPVEATRKNTDTFRRQMKSIGFSFDWSREINTTDPKYYRWTQWIFLQLYKAGLAYKAKIPINWCPSCKIGLANEEVVEGECERCGVKVEQREAKQWMLKITAYADKLLDGLERVDFLDRVKEQQKNWIGRKEGINITYQVKDSEDTITCFTTRPDTNFGATFVVVAPEHEFALQVAKENKEVADYLKKTSKKTEQERLEEGRVKTGAFTGYYAVNQLTGRKMPVWVSDFVLGYFGTGAVVGVPGHDKRDFEFAMEFGLPVVRVVVTQDGDESPIEKIEQVQEDEGVMINSEFLNGMNIHEATEKIMDYMEKEGYGERVVTYHLRDWVFSRQHYWGEPIPIIYCEKCGMVPVPEKDLPVELPAVKRYEPTDTGESPLAEIKEWVETECPECGGVAKRETDTMPNWAGSSWYFLRYIDPYNDEMFADPSLLKYWLPVDVYNGGMEHTTLHLLYSRFWNQFLYDQGLIPVSEPYAKRTSHGMVLGEDGVKMSKSRGNVINPDEVLDKYGADTLRVYEMFMGPFDGTNAWSTSGIAGAFRFLKRVWALSERSLTDQAMNDSQKIKMHDSIKRVTDSIDQFKFNTGVSTLMGWLNELEAQTNLDRLELETYAVLLAPLAPHLAEELWQKLGNENFVATQPWPKYDEKVLQSGEITIAVQVNGKLRGKLELSRGTSQAEVVVAAKALPNVTRHLKEVEIKKEIFVPDKLVNFVG